MDKTVTEILAYFTGKAVASKDVSDAQEPQDPEVRAGGFEDSLSTYDYGSATDAMQRDTADRKAGRHTALLYFTVHARDNI